MRPEVVVLEAVVEVPPPACCDEAPTPRGCVDCQLLPLRALIVPLPERAVREP
jgi:hypothetical protein